MRLRRWSLRTRLVVALVALLAVVCTLVGVATSIALQRYQLRQLDSQLQAAAGRAMGQLSNTSPWPFQWNDRCSATTTDLTGLSFLQAPGQPPGTLAARVDTTGSTSGSATVQAGYLDRSFCTHRLPAAEASTLTGLAPNHTLSSRSIGSLGDYRLTAMTAPDGGTLIVGIPLASIEATQRKLIEVEVGVSAVALLIAGVAAAAIIRGALRPLRRVAATATRVSAMPLDRGEVDLAVRVPDSDTDPRTETGQVGSALNLLLENVGSALAARHDSEVRVRQFVADASHELRTPLASIRGYAELVGRDPQALPPHASRAMGRIESEARRMTGLVEDLLLLARLDSGRPLDAEPVDLTQLVVDATSDAAAAGRDHTWRLDVPDDPVEVIGDAARLHQVLANLLTNARTHTPPGTSVTANLRRSPGDGRVVLAVIDDGPGIPADLLPHVFDRFARGDSSRSRAAGSSGLGLAIVSAIVAAQGGEVTVSSRPGQTAFLVTLPAAPAVAPVRAGAGAGSSRRSG